MAPILLRRSLAACTSFRRAFCAAAGPILRPSPPLPDHVLPHSVHGILNNYCDYSPPLLFARPSGHRISMPDDADSVYDHCNGLVLFHGKGGDDFVLNPATRRRALLPLPSDKHAIWEYAGAYLAFDPSISLHYKVFLVPDVDVEHCPNPDAEWPPAIYKLPVFSSMSGCWEETAFLRQGGPVGAVAEMQSGSREPVYAGPQRRYAEYWRGALYVHCRGAYVMRLSLSEDKYKIIKAPTNIEENKHAKPYLGRSVKGVYFAALKHHDLRVWTLDDSGEQMHWVLKYHINLEALCHQVCKLTQWECPWAILYDRSIEEYDDVGSEEWNSDNDDVLDIKENNSARSYGRLKFIGFHPYKEIVFLANGFDMVTYHLSSSKAQYLGNAFPDDYYGSQLGAVVEESFIYTPCFVDSLPKMDL
ncbi:unnamed protein product [Urochloa decumbens]|uniref:Uncharacterized protein n=1 Tax=Urochloa decumbens TaxID=240449 RepID=A0ABC9D8X4_9POAL